MLRETDICSALSKVSARLDGYNGRNWGFLSVLLAEGKTVWEDQTILTDEPGSGVNTLKTLSPMCTRKNGSHGTLEQRLSPPLLIKQPCCTLSPTYFGSLQVL